jgi:hypothetical protein
MTRPCRQDRDWLTRYLCEQVPGGLQVFALDKTVWEHPRARTLSELCYERSPSRAIEGPSIVQGHPYSLLGWIPQAGQSWALPISTERVTPACNAVDTGVAQVRALCEARSAQSGEDDEDGTVIACDGAYGNHRFLGGIASLLPDVGAVVRLRCDRVLFGPPGPYCGRGRRDLKHGERFAFKDPATWGEPAAQATFITEDWGHVRVRQWHHLHARENASVWNGNSHPSRSGWATWDRRPMTWSPSGAGIRAAGRLSLRSVFANGACIGACPSCS